MKNKIFSSFEEAVADITDGSSIMVFAWGLGRASAENLLRALYRQGTKDLTVISQNFVPNALGDYIYNTETERATPYILVNQVKKLYTSWANLEGPGMSALKKRVEAGKVEIEVMSLGTLVQRARAGGAGIGGFYTRVGVGTKVAEGKEKKVIDGKEYILEKPLRPDFGFVRAYKADKIGNLVYRGSVRATNPVIAMASKVTIAEVDEIVEVGELDPEVIVTPGIFVHRIVKVPEGGFGSPSHMRSLFLKTLRAQMEKQG